MNEAFFRTFDEFYTEVVNGIGRWFADHGLAIIGIVVGAWLVRHFGTQLILSVLKRTIRKDIYPTKTDRTKRLNTLEGLTKAILQIMVAVVAFVMIIAELGLDTTPLIASAGIIGVALGFGAQSLIKDLTSGLFIIIENQYRVGDVVELDNGVSGKVEAITIRTTVIRSLDGRLFHVPNGTINWTANRTSSFGGLEEDIVVGADTDITKLKAIINRVGKDLAADPEFSDKIQEPPQFLRVDGYDANGLRIKIVGKTGSDDAWDVKGALYERLVLAFRKAKIDIPYNQLTITNFPKDKKI